MIRVVLRSGKVLLYNSGDSIEIEGNTIALRTTGKNPGLVARVPLEIIERAEFALPCRIRRERLTKRGWKEVS